MTVLTSRSKRNSLSLDQLNEQRVALELTRNEMQQDLANALAAHTAAQSAHEASMRHVRGALLAGNTQVPINGEELAQQMRDLVLTEKALGDAREHVERESAAIEKKLSDLHVEIARAQRRLDEAAFLQLKEDYLRALAPAIPLARAIRKMGPAIGEPVPPSTVRDLLLAPDDVDGGLFFGSMVRWADYSEKTPQPPIQLMQRPVAAEVVEEF